MKNTILQGLPGIGKTTLIKKIATKLNESGIETSGFYTEEVRDNNQRVGFDVVTLDNKRGVLARKGLGKDSKYKVGAYNVYLEEFELIALPVFKNVKSILILDEIGKMELFSKHFQSEVEKAFLNQDIKIIATVPLKGEPALVIKLKHEGSTNLITVNSNNRTTLLDAIIANIVK